MIARKNLNLLSSAIYCLLATVFLLQSPSAQAYPVILSSSQLAPLFGLTRNQLIAVRADETGVRRVALQIDEVEDGAALVLREPYEVRKIRSSLPHPRRTDPFSGRLQMVHQMVLDDRDFALCSSECAKKIQESLKAICGNPLASIVMRISFSDTQKSLFVADCGMQMGIHPPREVKYDAALKKITTPMYEYTYQSEKNVFFKEIKSTKSAKPMLSQSELKAYLKPKFLFNMKFKDDDLISQVTSVSKHSQSLSLEVAMALNLLAMKINNQICCDVSFFEDSLYFPVVLDLPFSGSSFAKGSGLFFGFQTDPESKVQAELIVAQSPEGSDAVVLQQEKNIIVIGMRNPNKRSIDALRPKVVAKKDMTSMKFMPIQSDNGIFYDIQNAKEGFQHFNVWMFFGGEEDRAKLLEYAQYGPKIRVDYQPLQ